MLYYLLKDIRLRALFPSALLVVVWCNSVLSLDVVACSLLPGEHLLSSFDTLVGFVIAVYRCLGLGERSGCG